MKQTLFETKLRADELLQKAKNIWQKSDQSDMLESIETDPVLSLLMTALAYQANELEGDFEQMKADVLDEFAHMLTPYEADHALPATALIETSLGEGLEAVEVGPQHIFTITDTRVEFIPLLRTRVLNANVSSVVRLDGRRWKVTIDFKYPTTDLSGFCFAIKNLNYRDLDVSVKGQTLQIIKPWNYSELPLSPCFDIDSIFYNHSMTYQPSPVSLDLFAWQNVRLYYIPHYLLTKDIFGKSDSIDLTFEFSGINEDFVFSKNHLSLNTILLVNAQQHSVTLSSSSPIVRVAGSDDSSEKSEYSRQFLHVLRPAEEQLFGDTPIEVRRIAADRFNNSTLVKLLNNLLNKYYSDFYAFQNIQDAVNDKTIHGLTEILQRLQSASRRDKVLSASGVYLMLSPTINYHQAISLDISYVTTAGAAINDLLNVESTFVPPTGFDLASTRLVATPIPGVDEIRDKKVEASLRRYHITTHDRLVTPADIKQFCYHQLLTHFNIVRDMVKSITINHRQQQENRLCGYEIVVEITLRDNSFVKRGFVNKIQHAEVLLKSMMKVRSANIYPIQVIIKLETDNK